MPSVIEPIQSPLQPGLIEPAPPAPDHAEMPGQAPLPLSIKEVLPKDQFGQLSWPPHFKFSGVDTLLDSEDTYYKELKESTWKLSAQVVSVVGAADRLSGGSFGGPGIKLNFETIMKVFASNAALELLTSLQSQLDFNIRTVGRTRDKLWKAQLKPDDVVTHNVSVGDAYKRSLLADTVVKYVMGPVPDLDAEFDKVLNLNLGKTPELKTIVFSKDFLFPIFCKNLEATRNLSPEDIKFNQFSIEDLASLEEFKLRVVGMMPRICDDIFSSTGEIYGNVVTSVSLLMAEKTTFIKTFLGVSLKRAEERFDSSDFAKTSSKVGEYLFGQPQPGISNEMKEIFMKKREIKSRSIDSARHELTTVVKKAFANGIGSESGIKDLVNKAASESADEAISSTDYFLFSRFAKDRHKELWDRSKDGRKIIDLEAIRNDTKNYPLNIYGEDVSSTTEAWFNKEDAPEEALDSFEKAYNFASSRVATHRKLNVVNTSVSVRRSIGERVIGSLSKNFKPEADAPSVPKKELFDELERQNRVYMAKSINKLDAPLLVADIPGLVMSIIGGASSEMLARHFLSRHKNTLDVNQGVLRQIIKTKLNQPQYMLEGTATDSSKKDAARRLAGDIISICQTWTGSDAELFLYNDVPDLPAISHTVMSSHPELRAQNVNQTISMVAKMAHNHSLGSTEIFTDQDGERTEIVENPILGKVIRNVNLVNLASSEIVDDLYEAYISAASVFKWTSKSDIKELHDLKLPNIDVKKLEASAMLIKDMIDNNKKIVMDKDFLTKLSQSIRETSMAASLVRDSGAISKYMSTAKPKVKEVLEIPNMDGQGFRFRVLQDLDPYHFTVGADTSCCQVIGGQGEAAAIDSFINPLAGVLILEVLLDNRWVLAYQSYFHYVPEDSSFILDNIEENESVSGKITHKIGTPPGRMYAALAQHLKDKIPGLKYVGLGLAYTKISTKSFGDLSLKSDPRSFEYDDQYTDFKYSNAVDLLKYNDNLTPPAVPSEPLATDEEGGSEVASERELTSGFLAAMAEQEFPINYRIVGAELKEYLLSYANSKNIKIENPDRKSLKEIEDIVFGVKIKQSVMKYRAQRFLRSLFRNI